MELRSFDCGGEIMKISNVVERALWTAAQTFLATVTSFAVLTDVTTLQTTLLAGAIAAGASLLSALKTLVQERVETT